MKRKLNVSFRDDGTPYMEWTVTSDSDPKWAIVWDYALRSGNCVGAVTWHAPTPFFDFDLTAAANDCTVTGGACWVDVGYMISDETWDRLQSEGDEGVWQFLEECLADRMLMALTVERAS